MERELRKNGIVLILGSVILVVMVLATHMSPASGQASEGSPAFQEEQRQTLAMERQARALEGIHTVLQRMDRRCR